MKSLDMVLHGRKIPVVSSGRKHLVPCGSVDPAEG